MFKKNTYHYDSPQSVILRIDVEHNVLSTSETSASTEGIDTIEENYVWGN